MHKSFYRNYLTPKLCLMCTPKLCLLYLNCLTPHNTQSTGHRSHTYHKHIITQAIWPLKFTLHTEVFILNHIFTFQSLLNVRKLSYFNHMSLVFLCCQCVVLNSWLPTFSVSSLLPEVQFIFSPQRPRSPQFPGLSTAWKCHNKLSSICTSCVHLYMNIYL